MELEEKLKLLKRLKNDSRYYIKNCLKIICEGELVDFKINYPQELVLNAIAEQEVAGKPIRIIILKARREGISTLIEALIYHRISMRSHRTAVVIAHELDGAKEIFEMARRFNTEFRRLSMKPMLRSMGVRNLIFDNPDPENPKRGLDSKLVVETAMDVQAGRTMEINYLHCSEVAFYRDAETLMTGLLQCVNDRNPDTMIIMESTANGLGGYFYDCVQAAANGENDYKLIFLPWFIDPRYSIPPPADFKLTQEDEKIRSLYQWEGKKLTLTDGQLCWRRKKIANSFNGDEVQFKQEFPGSVTEAFTYSGRTRFNQDALTDIEGKVRLAIFKGFLHEKPLTDKKLGHTLEENPNGYLTIYQKPQHRKEYVIFADVSEGIEVADRISDYSAIDCLRCDTLEQVAHWHGRIGPELLKGEIERLARYFNEAFVGVEKNNMGYGVVADLKDSYPRLYLNIVHDKNGKEITREFGWRTTLKTKPLMINGLAEAINDGSIRINNLGTIEECRRYTLHPDGTLGAPAGLHDDKVISLAGAIQMYLHSYNAPKVDGPDPEDEDDEEEEDEE